MPANRVLPDRIGYLLKCPVGRPPHQVRRHYASFGYQAQSRNKPRRVVAKVGCIRASCTRASASSSPTWHDQPSASSLSTITAALRSSGSRKARARSRGPGCRAAPLPPTPSASSPGRGPAPGSRADRNGRRCRHPSQRPLRLALVPAARRGLAVTFSHRRRDSTQRHRPRMPRDQVPPRFPRPGSRHRRRLRGRRPRSTRANNTRDQSARGTPQRGQATAKPDGAALSALYSQ
jgi:hypothetical protein